MLLNWTYLEVLVAGGLGFVTLELLPTVLTGHHWHGLLMVYLTLSNTIKGTNIAPSGP